jgi:hypothetical protein
MRFNKWMAIAVCAALTTSCGENSTKETTSNADTTVTNETARGTETSESSNNAYNVNVPEATRTSFQTKYPNATNVTWRKYEPVNSIEWDWAGWPVLDTGDYAVSYNWDGTEYWSWYDENNNWVGSTAAVKDYSTMPQAVNNTIKSQYSGYTITSVDKENDKNRTAYEVDLEKGDMKMKVLISESGKVIKKKDMSTGEKSKTNPKDTATQ